ncbi:MAG: hypothetical protein SPL19_05765, partial [Fibrobacter sp.]|nr:hypothetical protein [Fibrobacter sp.]
MLTPFAPRAGLWGLAHSVRSACGAVGACSLRSLRVRGCGGLLASLACARVGFACSLRSLALGWG